jgi:hypothetical protein
VSPNKHSLEIAINKKMAKEPKQLGGRRVQITNDTPPSSLMDSSQVQKSKHQKDKKLGRIPWLATF